MWTRGQDGKAIVSSVILGSKENNSGIGAWRGEGREGRTTDKIRKQYGDDNEDFLYVSANAKLK